jgi:O-antigen ligase
MVLAGSRSMSMWLQMAGSAVEENVEGNPLDRLVFSGLLAMALGVLFARGRKATTAWTINGPLLVFFFYCAISTVWSDFPGIALKRWIKAIGDPVMIMIVLTDPNRAEAMKRFFARTAFFFMPVSILLIKYYPHLGLSFSRADGSMGYIGVATDKNMLGAICLFSGLGAVWRLLNAYRSPRPANLKLMIVAQGVILTMATWLLWVANSMTSIACLSFGSVLLFATSFNFLARKRVLIHIMVIMAIAAACIPLFLDAAGGALEAVGRDPTLTQRTELWGEVIRLTPNPIVGSGFESFWLGPRLETLWEHFWWRPNESHNGYIEVYLNLGWVGIVLLGVLLLMGYRNALAELRRNPPIGSLKLAALVAGVMYGLTEAGFRMMHPMWISTMLAAMALPATAAVTKSVSEKEAVESPYRRQPTKRWGGARAFDAAATTVAVRPTRSRIARRTDYRPSRWPR